MLVSRILRIFVWPFFSFGLGLLALFLFAPRGFHQQRLEASALNLDQVCCEVPALAEKLSKESFAEHLASLKNYYAADCFALARLAQQEASVYHNLDHSPVKEQKTLAEGLEQLHQVSQELLLLQMEMRTSLAIAKDDTGDRAGEIAGLKEAMGMFADIAYPTFDITITKDRQLMDRGKQVYAEAARMLINNAQPEDVVDFSIHPAYTNNIARTWAAKLEVIAPVDPWSTKKNDGAIDWMKILLKDDGFTSSEQAAVNAAIAALQARHDRSAASGRVFAKRLNMAVK